MFSYERDVLSPSSPYIRPTKTRGFYTYNFKIREFFTIILHLENPPLISNHVFVNTKTVMKNNKNYRF